MGEADLLKMRELVDQGLERLILDQIAPEFGDLRDMLLYHLGIANRRFPAGRSGKRLRPLLTFLSAQACGAEFSTALPGALAVEVLHNFSLIHDDIQDQSGFRHGRETVWKVWGSAQAINAGDTMFVLAFRTLDGWADSSLRLQARQLLEKTSLKLTEGQFLDMRFETTLDVSEEQYMQMIKGKTAALLSCCAQLGALSSAAAPGVIEGLGEYAGQIGMAFQIQDDLLGIWGDEKVTGKSVSSDILTRKKTLPVLFGLRESGAMRRIWQKPGELTAEDCDQIKNLLDETGARTYAENRFNEAFAHADLLLRRLDLPGGMAGLSAFARQLMNRSA